MHTYPHKVTRRPAPSLVSSGLLASVLLLLLFAMGDFHSLCRVFVTHVERVQFGDVCPEHDIIIICYIDHGEIELHERRLVMFTPGGLLK